MFVLCPSRNVHFLKEGYNINTLCAVLHGGVYMVLWRLKWQLGAWNSARSQAVIKQSDEGEVFVEWGDVEQLLHPGKAIKQRFDLRIAHGELVLLHLDPGTMLLHGAFEELLHCLARDGYRVHQVPRWAGRAVLPDAAVHVLCDANLEAIAKESEHVQMLLLCSQTVQLLLKRVGTSALDCLCSSSLLHLLGDDVVLQDLLEVEDEFASSLALGCLSRYHEFLELVERYLVDVSWTPSASCRILHTAVDNVLVAGELPFQEPESTVLPVNTQPLEDIIKVNVQSIRVVVEILAEGASKELL